MLECRVLQTGREVDEAEARARALGLIRPPVREKYWDNAFALDALAGLEDAPVIDLGCRSGVILTWLHQRRFRDLAGCDLRRPWPPVRGALRRRRWNDALAASSMYLRHRGRMSRASIEDTQLPAGRFAAATSMSVIEHGVDVPRFFAEAWRILRPGGLLIVSTDYWPDGGRDAAGRWNDRPDTIFDRRGLEGVMAAAAAAGFAVPEPAFEAKEPVVRWGGAAYTFAAMSFRRDDTLPRTSPGSAQAADS
jgi:SAM-dependent methyltransferase